MRIANLDSLQVVNSVSLYLTIGEAEELRSELDQLLHDPESDDHSHVVDAAGRRITIVVMTMAKLARVNEPRSKWTEFGRKVLGGEWQWS